MATPISTLQQQLISYSTQTSLTNFNKLVSSLTPTQVSQIGSQTFDNALINLSTNGVATPASVTSSINSYLTKVGAFIDGYALSNSLANLATVNNLTGVNAVLNHLQPGQSSSMGGPDLDNAIILLAYDPASSSLTNTITNFMTHVGMSVDGSALSNALSTLAQMNNQAGIKAIVTHLQPGQAQTLGGPDLDNAIIHLSYEPTATASEQSALAGTLSTFMTQVGMAVDGSAISNALSNLAQTNNQTGIKAIIDHLQPGQAQTLGGPDLDNTIIHLSYEPTPTPTAQNQLAHTLTDFMIQVGMSVDGSAISNALSNLSQSGNQNGVKAIVDNLQPGQAQTLGGPDLDNALILLSYLPTPTTQTQSVLAATIGDFMTKVGMAVDGSAISNALENLAATNNQVAIRAIVDHLQPGQAQTLGGPDLDNTLIYLGHEPTPTQTAQSQLAATITDFMTHVGSSVSTNAIADAIHSFIQANAAKDVSAVATNVDPGQVQGVLSHLTTQDNAYLSSHHIVVG